MKFLNYFVMLLLFTSFELGSTIHLICNRYSERIRIVTRNFGVNAMELAPEEFKELKFFGDDLTSIRAYRSRDNWFLEESLDFGSYLRLRGIKKNPYMMMWVVNQYGVFNYDRID